ncbi:hypothetical protein FGO68_gene1697 [Halteria grandinella]|uniref:Uncharacterized protein n=1 Tax=Halteria grandinella TaxID=5974 RepID=A0A8J8NIE2_HALGN|nr:hypothetical protein FGO68_gene1697 [Halteria grandinella]
MHEFKIIIIQMEVDHNYSFEHLQELAKQKNITYVLKRDGEKQFIDIEKIAERLKNLAFGLQHININLIMWKVIQGMYEGKPLIKFQEQLQSNQIIWRQKHVLI